MLLVLCFCVSWGLVEVAVEVAVALWWCLWYQLVSSEICKIETVAHNLSYVI